MHITQWLLGLALAATGCLDSSGGPFAEDQPIEHDYDGVPDAEDCAPYDSGLWELLPAYVDHDRDGYGAGAQVTSCFGDGRSLPGYSVVGTDCDDADYAAWQLVERYADADLDGVGSGDPIAVCAGTSTPAGYADSTGDCAPDDGTRWQELAYLHRDADLDGETVPSEGVVCAGGWLPGDYRLDPAGFDCDDGDPLRSLNIEGYVDADGDHVGTGTRETLCTVGWLPAGYAPSSGDCAPSDGTRWRDVAYSFVDLDADGYTVASMGTICAGNWLPAGYRTTPSSSGTDCDDGAATLWTTRNGYLDSDGDGYGAGSAQSVCSGSALPTGWVATTSTDCEPDDPARWRSLAYSRRDADGDGYTVAETGSICIGQTTPAGWGAAVGLGNDCNDADPSLFAELYGYPDVDGDGVGVAPPQVFCTSGALPAGFAGSNETAADCAPDDPLLWAPFKYAYVDRDGDGYTARETGTLCIGAALPDPYRAAAAGNDCDDADPALYRWVVLYEDKDGDGIGAPPRWIPCLGATLPAGWSIFGYDEDDTDSAVKSDAAADDVLFTILD